MTEMSQNPDKEIIERLAEELRRLHEKPNIQLNISPTAAWCLIIQIQLVGRHPSNNNWMYENVKLFAHQLESALELSDWLKEYTEKGWNPELDVEVRPPE